MTEQEFAYWTARTKGSEFRWTENEIVRLNGRGGMYYRGGVDGIYLRIHKDGLLEFGKYEGAVPHIGEAIFKRLAERQVKDYNEAFTAAIQLGGKQFLVDMFSGQDYLRSAELSTEQNYNMAPDGLLNNIAPPKADLTDGQTHAELRELAPQTLPEEIPAGPEKPSLLARVEQFKADAAAAPVEPVPEPEPERWHTQKQRRCNMHNGFPSRELVESLRQQYPQGTRVELVSMNDPYTDLKPGDKGRVMFVDDAGTIHTRWDNGSGLGIAYGEDSVRRLEPELAPQTLPEETHAGPEKPSLLARVEQFKADAAAAPVEPVPEPEPER